MEEVCEICLQPISHPVCTPCYLKHARGWLEDFGLSQNRIKTALAEIRSKLPQETLNNHKCVLCRKENVSVCMFCSFLRTSRVLLKLANQKTKESYIQSSNFMIEETNY